MQDGWGALLKKARLTLGLKQHDLARRAGISVESLRSYESGRRNPGIAKLKHLLDVMAIDRSERTVILEAAGFPTDGYQLRPQNDDLMYSAEEACAEVEQYAWPSFLCNEYVHVICANGVAQALWGVDLRSEFTDPIDRNLLSVASNPRFAERCENWDEAIAYIVAGFKGHHRGGQEVDEPTNAYFAAVLERFLNGDPKYVARFLKLWEDTPAKTPKIRWSYPVVWRDPAAGLMRFHCFASSANETEGLAFNDWIPLDEQTWTALRTIAARGTK